MGKIIGVQPDKPKEEKPKATKEAKETKTDK